MIQTDAAINPGQIRADRSSMRSAKRVVVSIPSSLREATTIAGQSQSVRHSHNRQSGCQRSSSPTANGAHIHSISVQTLPSHRPCARLREDRGVVVSEISKKQPPSAARLLRGDIIGPDGQPAINSSADIGGFFLDLFCGRFGLSLGYVRQGQADAKHHCAWRIQGKTVKPPADGSRDLSE